MPQDSRKFQGYFIYSTKNIKLEEIFKYFWKSQILNVLVALSVENCFHIFSYDLFRENFCRQIFQNLVRVICNEKDLDVSNIFPDQLKDLQGCPIIVLATEILPFIKMDGNNISFLEAEMIKRFAKDLNASIEVVPYRPYRYREVIHLLQTSRDIIIGGFLMQKDRIDNFSFSYAHDRSNFIMAMKNQRTRIPSIEVFLKPFDLYIWILLIVIFVMSSTILAIFGNDDNSTAILIIFSALIGTGHHRIDTLKSSLRSLMFYLLILSIIVPSTYLAVMFTLMKSDLLKPLPRNFEELVDSKYTDTFVYDVDISFTLLKSIPEYQKRATHFKLKQVPLMSTGVFESKTPVVGVGNSRFFNYEIKNKTQFYYVLPEKFSTFFFTTYATKNSFLANKLDKSIIRMHRTGFFKPLIREIEGTVQADKPSETQPLKLSDVSTVFKIWITFLAISAWVFIYEVFIKKALEGRQYILVFQNLFGEMDVNE